MTISARITCTVSLFVVMASGASAQSPPADPGPPPERMHAGFMQARNASIVPLQVQLNRGYPQIVAGRFNVPGATPGAKARTFVKSLANLYGQNFDRNLKTQLRRAGSTGAVLGQTYRGVPVYGARLSVAVGGNQVFGSVGRLATDLRLDPRPKLTAAAAEDKLRAALGRSRNRLTGDPRLVIYVPELVTGAPPGPARPAFQITIDGNPPVRALVDGNTGEVLLQEPLELDALVMNLFDANQKEPAEGECFSSVEDIDLAATQTSVRSGYANDGDVTTARTALTGAYSVFKNFLGRRSYDGLDSPLIGYVHAKVSSARWSSGCHDMAARDGVVTRDVWIHELGHGVTQFTSGLKYHFQSGALNESFSDMMAATGDTDWLLDGGSLGIVRDMADPASKGHPGHMLDYQDLPDTKAGDWGGVHINSGIPNKARQLMADGGTWPGAPRNTFTVGAIGRPRVAKIAYLGNLVLDSNADFEDAAGIEFVMAYLYSQLLPNQGIGAIHVCSVRNAWAAVGVAVSMADRDCDGKADSSDTDVDGDGIPNGPDNCPQTASQNLKDSDGDGLGNPCDPDIDGDGVANGNDNCSKYNPNQADANGNGKGDVCDDHDSDGVLDPDDNCLVDWNPSQVDSNKDGQGDACEVDSDGDGIDDDDDSCQFVAVKTANKDGDTLGDACDPCPGGFDVVVAYTSGNAQLGTKPQPILRDSDNDGIPDGCEKISREKLLAVSGDKLSRPVAIRPGSRRELLLRAARGARFRVQVPPCIGKPCGTLIDRGGLVQVLIGGLGSGVGIRLVDDLGTNIAAARKGAAGAIVLRFRPQADRTYFLEGLVKSRLARSGDRFAVRVTPVG